MGAFQDFVSLVNRFRWAGEYNGHLAHVLDDLIDAGNAKIRPRLREALLEELRGRLCDPAEVARAIGHMMRELLACADRFRTSRGPTKAPLPCPWCDEGVPAPSIDDPETDGRTEFCDGEQARRQLLAFINAEEQLGFCVRSFLGPARILDSPTGRNDRAWRAHVDRSVHAHVQWVLDHPEFRISSYGKATFDFLDQAVDRFRRDWSNTLGITREDIAALEWKCGRNQQIVFAGRFGSIARGILEKYYGRYPDDDRSPEQTIHPEDLEAFAATSHDLEWSEFNQDVETCLTHHGEADQRILAPWIQEAVLGDAEGEAAMQRIALRFDVTVDYVAVLVNEFARCFLEMDPR